MKKMFFLLLLVLTMFSIKDVNAGYNYIANDCVDDKTCLLLCNYNFQYTQEGSHSTGYQKRNVSRSISIYLHFDNQMSMKWETVSNNGFIYSKKPMHASKLFSKSNGSNVFISDAIDLDNFTCPTYGYIDLSNLAGGDSVCFDNDGKYCADQSIVGRSFGTSKKIFVSSTNDYNMFDHIDNYFRNWTFGDISCNDLASDDYDLVGSIKDKTYTDFKTNFLYGNEVPYIINKKIENKYEEIIVNVEKGLEDKIAACDAEINAAVGSGAIDKITADELRENLNNINQDEVMENFQEAMNEVFEENYNYYYEGMDCKTLFGEVTDPNYPAYWIQCALDLIKYIAIIAVFGLSTVDFIKAIASQDNDALQKAALTAVKRFVFAVIIFFLPIIIEFLMNLFGAYGTCGFE